jgi:hypothetical protein
MTQREEKGACRATARRLADRAREAEREEGRVGKKTGADRLAPLGSERGWEGAREVELSLTGEVCLSNDAGTQARGLAGPTGLVWAAFSFSFSLNFLIPFPFLFL